MRTEWKQSTESLLAWSWWPRMLFIIIMLLLETRCHMRNFSWKVKHALFIHLHTFVSKGSIKKSLQAEGSHLERFSSGERNLQPLMSLLMNPCYLLSSITRLLWSAFLPFLLLAFIASFSCYAIFKLIQAIAPSYHCVTFRVSNLSQSQQRYSAGMELVIKGFKWKKHLPNLESNF